MPDKNHITPRQVWEAMMAKDRFSHWMGLELDHIAEGSCKLHYTVTQDMLNGFDIIHGGVLFAASDSAFAFACNSHGMLTVALDASVSFTKAARAGDQLFVEAKEVSLGNRTGVYDVTTTNERGEILAVFRGTSYKTSKAIDPV
jgi:acyl-CoA thioesterase